MSDETQNETGQGTQPPSGEAKSPPLILGSSGPRPGPAAPPPPEKPAPAVRIYVNGMPHYGEVWLKTVEGGGWSMDKINVHSAVTGRVEEK